MITSPQHTNLDTLPEDIIKEVVPHLTPENIINLYQVCKSLKEVIDNIDVTYEHFLNRLAAIDKEEIHLSEQGNKALPHLLQFKNALPKIATKQWGEILALVQSDLKCKDESGALELDELVKTLKSFNKPIAQLSSLEERRIILDAVRRVIIKADNEPDNENISVFGRNNRQGEDIIPQSHRSRTFVPGLKETKGKGLKKMMLTRAPQKKSLPDKVAMDIDKKEDDAKDKKPKM